MRKVRGLRYGISTAVISVDIFGTSFKNFGFGFLRKCQNIYFPLIDGSDPRVDFLFCATALVNNNQSKYTLSVLPEFLPEIDTLLGRNFNLVKTTCTNWVVKFTLSTNRTTTGTYVEHFNTLRAYGFPAYYV